MDEGFGPQLVGDSAATDMAKTYSADWGWSDAKSARTKGGNRGNDGSGPVGTRTARCGGNMGEESTSRTTRSTDGCDVSADLEADSCTSHYYDIPHGPLMELEVLQGTVVRLSPGHEIPVPMRGAV